MSQPDQMLAEGIEDLRRERDELQKRLDKVMELHGDGMDCQICGCAWACHTWQAASGQENSKPDASSD